MNTINLDTHKRNEFIDITAHVQKAVRDSKIKDGICTVFCPHTTAGVTINENADPSVVKDILKHLDEMVPAHKNYTHSEGNSDSHIKSSLVGCSVNVIIENSALALGTWQGIYFCEFDGPRQRKIYTKIIEAESRGY